MNADGTCRLGMFYISKSQKKKLNMLQNGNSVNK